MGGRVPIEFFIAAGIICILLLVALILFAPGERLKKRKRRKEQQEALALQKDWEGKAKRMEHHVHSLRNEILELQKKDKENEKKLLVEGVKIKKLQEKLTQERQWHEKEHDSIEKKGKEFQRLKAELGDVQESSSKEHAANLRYEQQLKEAQQFHKSVSEELRKTQQDMATLRAQAESQKKEIAQLKKENIRLKKEEDDKEWVAKTEYERVTGLLKANEKELDRLKKQNEK